jgi:hypothetical protein
MRRSLAFGDGPPQRLDEPLGTLRAIALSSLSGGQRTVTCDAAVTKAREPTRDLRRDGLCPAPEIGKLRVESTERPQTLGDGQDRPDLASGAAGIVQETDQFPHRATIEALGDVVGHGQGRALKLVGQVAREPGAAVCGQLEDSHTEINGVVPHGKLFEPLAGHCTSICTSAMCNLASAISHLRGHRLIHLPEQLRQFAVRITIGSAPATVAGEHRQVLEVLAIDREILDQVCPDEI